VSTVRSENNSPHFSFFQLAYVSPRYDENQKNPVSDEADHVYDFSDGFTLEAGVEVTLYTGSGTDSDIELYWGQGRAVWNNAGDTVTVTDDNGEEGDVYQY
jgi:hypothetical protein